MSYRFKDLLPMTRSRLTLKTYASIRNIMEGSTLVLYLTSKLKLNQLKLVKSTGQPPSYFMALGHS